MNFHLFLLITTSPWISHRFYSLGPQIAGLIPDPITDLYWNPVDTLPRWVAIGGGKDSLFVSYGSKWVSIYLQGGLEVGEEGDEETLRLEHEKIYFAVRTYHLRIPLAVSFLHIYKKNLDRWDFPIWLLLIIISPLVPEPIESTMLLSMEGVGTDLRRWENQ